MSERNPAPMPWRQAWKVLPSWNRLHRVAVIEEHDYQGWNEDPEDVTSIFGVTCCGARGHLLMPGILSRMGMTRCRKCARIAGVDPGLPGIPGNGDRSGPRDAWQEDYA